MEVKRKNILRYPNPANIDLLEDVECILDTHIEYLDYQAIDQLKICQSEENRPKSCSSCIAETTCQLNVSETEAPHTKVIKRDNSRMLTKSEIHICNLERLLCSVNELQDSIKRLQTIGDKLEKDNLAIALWLLNNKQYESFSKEKLKLILRLKPLSYMN